MPPQQSIKPPGMLPKGIIGMGMLGGGMLGGGMPGGGMPGVMGGRAPVPGLLAAPLQHHEQMQQQGQNEQQEHDHDHDHRSTQEEKDNKLKADLENMLYAIEDGDLELHGELREELGNHILRNVER